MKFSEFNLHEKVLAGVEAAQFENCMPVQEKVYQHSLKGLDVMVQSQTGSGKTAAFLIPILQKFAEENHQNDDSAEQTGYHTRSLIIVPTRELAVQIEADAKILTESALSDLRIGCFYGGIGYKKQDEVLEKGVDLYIGTPGRIIDYAKMGKIDFKKIDVIVIDEADRLFDMGFYPDIRSIFQKAKPREERQTLLFSATLSNRARNLAWEYMNSPVEIEIEPEHITVDEIRQELYHVSKDEKFLVMLRLLEKYKPDNAIIFTNTKSRAVEISKRLELNGYNARFLMGDLPQKKRLQVIDNMKQGKIQFLVATDVAARGLHVEDLSLVINFDIPEDFENYVHRIGRTARAGKSGVAITLACEQFVYGLEAIETYIGRKIPVEWIDETLPQVEDKSAGKRFRDLVDMREFGIQSGGYERTTSSQQRKRNSSGNQSKGGTRKGSSAQGRKTAQRSNTKRVEPGIAPAHRDTITQGKSETVRVDRKKSARNTQKPHIVGESRKPYKTGVSSGANHEAGKSVDYTKISSLSFEERLAFYKKQYDTQSGNTTQTEKPAASKNPQKPAGYPKQTAVKKDKTSFPGKNNNIEAVEVNVPEKKKKGLFARLFKR